MRAITFFLSVMLLQRGVGAEPQASQPKEDLTVRTATGIFTGLIDSEFPNTRQFRNIPYAQAPVGRKRWMPPVAMPASNRHSYAYNFPPSCPQFLPSKLSVWNTNMTDYSIDVAGQSHSAGAYAQTSAEDCLSLAIWAPKDIPADTKLPVILFMPGGSFMRGGISVPYQMPGGWVERSGRHIAVTINYRVNILGYPYAAGLEDQNPGVLDQRMALEWVHANIAAFGGDRDRITLWGQSAGGVGADILMYAYPDEPLAAGVFLQSGTAMVNLSYPDRQYRNFTFVAKNLGCDFPATTTADAAAAELACMQEQPITRIQNFMGHYTDQGTEPRLLFQPTPDDRTVFFNYTARAEKGLMARIPALVSTTANEEASLTKYPVENVAAGPNQTKVDQSTVEVFVCLTSNTTDARARLNLTTYRYQYAGNFSNLTPLPWLGAYHASDIPLLMGTYEKQPGATDFQRQVAQTMQDYLFAFMVDPLNGLREKGWLPHNKPVAEGGNMIRFASKGEIIREADASEVDNACVLGTPYNPRP